MVQERKFRADLLYRLNVFPIALPPLRERKKDIPLLVEHFARLHASKAGKKIRQIDESTLELLNAYDWPGNVRELQNIVERAVIVMNSDTLLIEAKWLRTTPAASSIWRDELSVLAQHEVDMIEAALAESNGRISGPSGAATKLRMPRQTLESKIRRLGINRYGLKVQLPLPTPRVQAVAARA